MNSAADDDPEKRIRELEHQLAEQQRPAVPTGLPGPTPDQGEWAPSRVFAAYVLDTRWGFAKSIGVNVAIIATPIVLAALLHRSTGEVAFWLHDVVLFGVLPVAALVSVFRSRRLPAQMGGGSRRVTISVTADRLEVLDGRRAGQVFPLADAALGPWTPFGAPPSSAMHLRNSQQQFIIGGRNPSVPVRAPIGAKPVRTADVNASLPTAEFEELLHLVFG